jgi:hypothetical protein
VTPERSAADAVLAFRIWVDTMSAAEREAYLAPLRGHDLACFCPLTDKDGNPVPCHANELLKFANVEAKT